MSTGEHMYPYPYVPNYWPSLVQPQQNYCPTCDRPWYGGWTWPKQPEVWCKTYTAVCQKS